ATAHLFYLATVLVDPVAIAQRNLAVDGDDVFCSCTFAAAISSDFQRDRLARSSFEQLEDLVASLQFASVDFEQIVALIHDHARLSERRTKLRIPVFAAIDLHEAIAAIFDRVVGAKQSGVYRARSRWSKRWADVHVTDGDVAQHVFPEIA